MCWTLYNSIYKKKLFSNAIVFEPNIDSFKLLEMNIYLNNLENKISAKNVAIGNKNSFLYINTIKNHSTDSYIKKI